MNGDMKLNEYEMINHDDSYWKKKNIKSQLYIIIQIILGIPKTIYFNIRYLGLDGLRIPILLSYKVKLKKCKGKVYVDSKQSTGMIKLGFTSAEAFDNAKLSFLWINDGIIHFKGKAGIRNGVVIRNYGNLVFGNEFHISSPSTITCYRHIEFGEDVLIGWNCEIADGDAHKIYYKGDGQSKRINNDASIIIGNHVWICANVKIQKGVKVGNNIVIASNTILTKTFGGNDMVIGGSPVRCLKEDINWKV